jgi:hypothetical protein
LQLAPPREVLEFRIFHVLFLSPESRKCAATELLSEVIKSRPAAAYLVSRFKLNELIHLHFLSQALSLAIRPPEREIETLNDRGLELAVADLVKNYLFSLAGYHR